MRCTVSCRLHGIKGALLTFSGHCLTLLLPVFVCRTILAISTVVAITARPTLATMTVAGAFITPLLAAFGLSVPRSLPSCDVQIGHALTTLCSQSIQAVEFRRTCLITCAVVLTGRAIRAAAIATSAVFTSTFTSFRTGFVVALRAPIRSPFIACFYSLIAIAALLAFAILGTLPATSFSALAALATFRALPASFSSGSILVLASRLLRGATLFLRDGLAFCIRWIDDLSCDGGGIIVDADSR